MTYRFLGPEFDIHGGGTDLVFPHHENEMTQSRAAGHDFAGFWLHNGMVDLGGEKMAKSVGNVIDVGAVQERGIRPVELRYYMLAPHYRARIEFSWGALEEAATAYQRIEGFLQRASELADIPPSVVCAEFEAAMNDDLNTSAALAAIHEVVREGNTALAAGEIKTAAGAAGSVRAMLGLLGLDPFDLAFAAGGEQGMRDTVDALVALALQQRASARERKDWAAADAVRDQLKQAGVAVEDTPQGPRWTIGADRNGG
jgi:cysteinyl-tRNA synthetase